MNKEEFLTSFKNLVSSVDSILNGKGLEYRTNEDVFSNFKSLSEVLGLTKYQIWSVYFFKHITSIQNSIKTNPSDPSSYGTSEKIDSRIQDAIAYLCLLQGMLDEDNQLKNQSKKE